MSKHTYTLEAGRSILRDGKPFVTIHRSEGVAPGDADDFAREIVKQIKDTPKLLPVGVYHDTLGSLFVAVDNFLTNNSVTPADLVWSENFSPLMYGQSITKSFELLEVEEHPTRKWLHVSIYRLSSSGKYELTVYIL